MKGRYFASSKCGELAASWQRMHQLAGTSLLMKPPFASLMCFSSSRTWRLPQNGLEITSPRLRVANSPKMAGPAE